MRVRWRFQASSSPGRAGVAKTPCFTGFNARRSLGPSTRTGCMAVPASWSVKLLLSSIPSTMVGACDQDVTDKNGCSCYRITHFAGFCCGYGPAHQGRSYGDVCLCCLAGLHRRGRGFRPRIGVRGMLSIGGMTAASGMNDELAGWRACAWPRHRALRFTAPSSDVVLMSELIRRYGRRRRPWLGCLRVRVGQTEVAGCLAYISPGGVGYRDAVS